MSKLRREHDAYEPILSGAVFVGAGSIASTQDQNLSIVARFLTRANIGRHPKSLTMKPSYQVRY